MTPLPPDTNNENEREILTLSATLRRMGEILPHEEALTVGQILHALGLHGILFLLLALALLNVVIFMVPGLSIFFGLPMIILAVQMVLGARAPVFPDFILMHRIEGATLQRGLVKAVEVLEKIERAVRPRFLVMTDGPWTMRAHGLVALLLGVMVAIPLPFFNLPPTFGMICLCVGLLQRDGSFLIGAYLLALWSFWLYESLHNAAQSFF